ncbi:hypothetical protein [Pedobacter deserti]|uniref:hypothetical protein n=1 Tax=Pedobacter deserti TaxID=2817382 RepID=UPI00210D72BF|nr:hypothetical protein [Pedobacter sp. SYSU D00382]
MPQKTWFELTRLEDMLFNELSPENIEETISQGLTAELESKIAEESRRVCAALREHACSDIKARQLERITQMHQREATKMLDLVYSYIRPDAEEQYRHFQLKEACIWMYTHFKSGVKRILNYIERDMNGHFDLHQFVPESFRVFSAGTLAKDKDVLHAKLRSKSVDEKLLKLLLAYFDEHCSKPECTYAEQRYAKLVMRNLLGILKSNREKDWNRKVVVELIYLNFNKSSFFTWSRRYIAALVDDHNTNAGQVASLNWFLKEIEVLDTKPNMFYRSERPGVKELLCGYVTGELLYLAEQHVENPGMAVKDLKERAEHFSFKLQLGLSAAELALMAQLFIDVKVFVVARGELMKVMKFFAEHVSTRGAAQLSADNLYKLRTNAETRVIDAVEGILEEMLRVLRGGVVVNPL